MSELPFPLTMRRAAEILGCSATAIRLRITSDELPGSFKARTPAGRISWYITREGFEQMREYLDKPGGRRKRFKRRVRGSVIHYCCTCCGEWKHESEFLNCSKPSSWGKRTQCRICEQAKREVWRRKNDDHVRKTSKASYYRRKRRANVEGAKIMYDYRTKPHIDGDKVLAELFDAYPQSTLGQIALAMHVELQALKKCMGRKITLDKADRLLTIAGRQHALQELAPVPGLPGWSIHSDRCINALCGTIEKPHYGHGYCERCYNWIKRGVDPPIENGWSKYVDRCRRCKTTDRKHESRGLCSRCLYHVKRYENLDDYPTLYDPSKVGSRHGSVPKAKPAHVVDHRSSGNRGEGRKPGRAERDDSPHGELAEAGTAVR